MANETYLERITDAKRVWETNYRPSIETLLEKGIDSYQAALILAFCSVEHAYRAIHCFDGKEKIAQDAIRWASPYYSEQEAQEIAHQQETDPKKVEARIVEKVFDLRESLFNSLKHEGSPAVDVEITGGSFFRSDHWHGSYINGKRFVTSIIRSSLPPDFAESSQEKLMKATCRRLLMATLLWILLDKILSDRDSCDIRLAIRNSSESFRVSKFCVCGVRA